MRETPLAGVAPAQSLATVLTGDAFLVRRFLAASLRSRCHDVGIRENHPIVCRVAGAHSLILQTDAGHTIQLERDWARFIEVSLANE